MAGVPGWPDAVTGSRINSDVAGSNPATSSTSVHFLHITIARHPGHHRSDLAH